MGALVPRAVEPDYAEALLAYNTGEYRRASQILERLRREYPRVTEILELSALAYVGSKEESRAIPLYESLIASRKGEGEAAIASYRFELGRAQYRLRRFREARQNVELAKGNGFDEGACYLQLGLVDLAEKEFVRARAHFEKVLNSSNEGLKPAAQVYLAQVSARANDGKGVAKNYLAARSLASTALEDPRSSLRAQELARQVVVSTERDLKGVDHSQLLAHIGLYTGYDTNVLGLPEGAATGAATLSPHSVVTTLRYGISYATSPLRKAIQVVPSYRGSVNHNFNADTRNAQFFTHKVALYLTKEPLALSYYGLKVEGIYAMQYQVDPLTGKGKFATYSATGSFGPYFRYAWTPRWTLGADLFFQPTKNYLDDTFSDSLRQSGWGQLARIYALSAQKTRSWNPSATLTYDLTHTTGEEYRSHRLGLELGNSLYLSEKTTVATHLGVGVAFYGSRPAGSRQDQFVTASGVLVHQWTPSLSVLASLSALGNFSNVSTYRYTRLVGTGGANYQF